jgi:hypothetical protein
MVIYNLISDDPSSVTHGWSLSDSFHSIPMGHLTENYTVTDQAFSISFFKST